MRPRETEEERLVRELKTRWHVRVADIYAARLERSSPDSTLFADGRQQILAIQDPLAIGGIARVLSRGHAEVRLLMVEALGRLAADESTLNLVVVTLFDPEPRVRAAAAVALIPRKDGRVVGRFRESLQSDEDAVMRNAAYALGVLKAREAVADLARVLYSVERRTVRYKRSEVIGAVFDTFNRTAVAVWQGQSLPYRPQTVSVLGSGTLVGTTWVNEVQDIKKFRTDVQEALIAITGENFGFDAEAWIRWSRDHPLDE